MNLKAALNVAARRKEIWADAKMRKDKMIADAIRDKSRLPDDYWKEEFQERHRYDAAKVIVEVLSGG